MGGVSSRSQSENTKSVAAASATENVPSNYHTVTICDSLPKVNKDYNTYETRKDLPDANYWIHKVDNEATPARYKVQHIIANGSRDWNDFLEQMRQEVSRHVKNEAVELLTSNFSTTTKIESLLSCVAIMDTFKQYFEYRCIVTKCGIRNVHFVGTLDDWKLLRQKTEQLQMFSTSTKDSFGSYIRGLLPIIDQFIQTYQGQVDNKFWNKVMDIKHWGGGGSGSPTGTDVSGWFLRLCYGLHEEKKCDIQRIQLNSLVVPVLVENQSTNQSKTCYVAGGFHGINSHNNRHKPVMSLAVMDDTTTIKPLSAE
ncbi:unnamed protein product [Adineta steineri]|uniref:Uncharacterized protein n=1 Tax=Adineta steineri TaxID=433720 RepID=A0A819V561_9BILA|nr:unnamed protein product [Adineta steineri]CAF1090477.1 unnamed protein product [Adineta steineri]CAF3729114.1 unnamed protein product [Adineta steineri]CAF4099573.1 unnamed protein product [Adineta steineri]CAF4214731.1 unnamed protein product [Adineta steineri]